MAYTPDPTDPTNPFDTIDASTAAAEFRALKAYISSLIGGSGLSGINIFRKNAIIGGDFDINPWQRGLNFVSIPDSTYSADRWFYQKAGTLVQDLTSTADAPVIGTAYKNKIMDTVVNSCLQLNVTTAEPALGATDLAVIGTRIEGFNWKLLAQKPMVLSFWHKHTKVGGYTIGFRNGVDRSIVMDYNQAVSEAWEYEAIPIIASPAAGTWNYRNGLGLNITFCIAAGSTFTASLPNFNQWTVGSIFADNTQINGVDTIGNKFRLAQVQLESGTIATAFERRTEQEELALCQRYYEKSFNQGLAPAQNVGNNTGFSQFSQSVAAAASQIAAEIIFKALKRTSTATITTYNPFAANTNARNAVRGNDGVLSSAGLGDRSFTEFVVASAGSAVGDNYTFHWTADAEL